MQLRISSGNGELAFLLGLAVSKCHRFSFHSVNFLFSSDHHWHPYWRGGDGGDRSEDASLLPVRQHGEPDKPHRDHGREREDKHVRVHVQVRSCVKFTAVPQIS